MSLLMGWAPSKPVMYSLAWEKVKETWFLTWEAISDILPIIASALNIIFVMAVGLDPLGPFKGLIIRLP